MQGCGLFKTWCHVCVSLGLELGKRVRFCGGLFLEVTVFFRIKKSGHRAYVQVVENKRFDGAVRQSVIANLGRADDLIASGALASLLASGAKFTDQVLLITTLDEDSDGSLSVAAKRIGGPLLFGRIWERLGIADVLGELLKHRAFEFAVERAVFVGTLHRLFVSGSDRDCSSWMADYEIAGVEGLDLHHFYRAMAWLGEELEEKPAGALAPRCLKDLIEERLFDRRRDLFTDVYAVFMDTTSLSFYGEGGETLGAHGYSKDYRPDLKQMILAEEARFDGVFVLRTNAKVTPFRFARSRFRSSRFKRLRFAPSGRGRSSRASAKYSNGYNLQPIDVMWCRPIWCDRCYIFERFRRTVEDAGRDRAA